MGGGGASEREKRKNIAPNTPERQDPLEEYLLIA